MIDAAEACHREGLSLQGLYGLDLVARREVWPIVSDIRPLAEAEALHERLERGQVTGRAALLIP